MKQLPFKCAKTTFSIFSSKFFLLNDLLKLPACKTHLLVVYMEGKLNKTHERIFLYFYVYLNRRDINKLSGQFNHLISLRLIFIYIRRLIIIIIT